MQRVFISCCCESDCQRILADALDTLRTHFVSGRLERHIYTHSTIQKHSKITGCQLVSAGNFRSFQRMSDDVCFIEVLNVMKYCYGDVSHNFCILRVIHIQNLYEQFFLNKDSACYATHACTHIHTHTQTNFI